MFVDAHAHLYDGDPKSIVQNAKERLVQKIICASSDVESIQKAVAISDEFDEVFATIGIHPQDAESFDVGTKLRNIDTPEHLILSDELKEIVFKTINELPDELKTAITLRELEGMSYEEIADVMDCPVGTVRSRIFRAREFIENQLAPLVKH